jgi:hypothetical protein
MSKTQFVDFGNRGFWAYDVALGVFLKHLIDAAESHNQSNSQWLSELIGSWRTVACVDTYGLTIDPAWSDEQRKIFVELARTAVDQLGMRVSIPAAEMMSWKVLDNQGIFPRGEEAWPTEPIIELGNAIVALVSGTLPNTVDMNWLYGTISGVVQLKPHRKV